MTFPREIEFRLDRVPPYRVDWPLVRTPALAQFFPSMYVRDMKAIMQEPEIVTRNGKPVSVIIPIKSYEELLERVEDAGDIAWLKRARRKPLHYRPLEEYLAERTRG